MLGEGTETETGGEETGGEETGGEETGGESTGGEETSEVGVNAKVAADLQKRLAGRWANDEAARRQRAKKTPAEGEEPAPVTEADIERIMSEKSRQKANDQIRKSFREGITKLVSEPVTIGNYSGVFADDAEFDQFEGFMRKKISGNELSPRDLYTLHNLEKIIAAERAHAVKGFQKKMKGGRGSPNGGGRASPPGEKKEVVSPTGGRVASIEELFKLNNL